MPNSIRSAVAAVLSDTLGVDHGIRICFFRCLKRLLSVQARKTARV